MCALDDLRQLARIADQHDIARGTTHGDHVGEAHLPRLIDKQPIEALHILIAREEEGRAADHIGAGERSEESRVGKECVSTCRSRGSPYHKNKKKHKNIKDTNT